jgi:hypothetical protein
VTGRDREAATVNAVAPAVQGADETRHERVREDVDQNGMRAMLTKTAASRPRLLGRLVCDADAER